MNIERLNEIITNGEHVEILYKGHPVWIEKVDKDAETAQIRLINTREIKGVYIKELVDSNNSQSIKH